MQYIQHAVQGRGLHGAKILEVYPAWSNEYSAQARNLTSMCNPYPTEGQLPFITARMQPD
jgi:hypothetical protein